jgi:hypothetical protein
MTRLVGTCTKLLGALALLLVFAGSAHANTVSYTGEGTKIQPGQTKGLPVLMGFDLRGKDCPTGPHCFDHAKVQGFNGVSWAFPNCREVLDGVFELDKDRPRRVGRASPHEFSASGPNELYEGAHVTISGRFLRHGKTAKGWFTVTDSGCSTGRLYWIATPD